MDYLEFKKNFLLVLEEQEIKEKLLNLLTKTQYSKEKKSIENVLESPEEIEESSKTLEESFHFTNSSKANDSLEPLTQTEKKDSELKRLHIEIERLASELKNSISETEHLQSELEECKQQKNSEIMKNQKLSNSLALLERQHTKLTEEFRHACSEWERFESIYHSIRTAYEQYEKLSEVCKHALQGMFKNADPALFIAIGIQPDNICALWEYTKMQIMERNYTDIDKLSSLIFYFIEILNQTKSEPVYKIQPVSSGTFFDVESHIRTSTSKAAGKINKIYLYGYLNAKTNAIVKKSVIEI